jgi:hypothetical protein
MLLGHAAAAVAEEDPLDSPGDQHTVANHKQTLPLRRSSRRKRVPSQVPGAVRVPQYVRGVLSGSRVGAALPE